MTNVVQEFKSLINKYTDNKDVINTFWQELLKNYEGKKRYYHNLSHISELLQFYYEFESTIIKKEVVLFAIFYHDIIYDVKKNDNEEKSADFAKQRMFDLSIQTEKIELVYNYIVASKHHKIENNDTDLAFFLDFDMAILGKDWSNYLKYTQKIRKEYSIYPNILYRKGRKKALSHFLENKKIYKTEVFFNRFEKQARENMQKELDEL